MTRKEQAIEEDRQAYREEWRRLMEVAADSSRLLALSDAAKMLPDNPEWIQYARGLRDR